MNGTNNKILFPQESYDIIGACFAVYNEMGAGFLECIYQECLEIEFQARNLPAIAKKPVRPRYRQRWLKHFYCPDFLCFNKIILEIKAVQTLTDADRAQILNYLKNTRLNLGILCNFGQTRKLQYERFPNPYSIHSINSTNS